MEIAGDLWAEDPIHGDILNSILNHVPLLDLVSASHVSDSWNLAVSTSLQGRRRLNRIKPWLLIYTQSRRSPHSTTTHAYDPSSDMWIQIHQPSIDYISPLESSHSTLLYMLSPTKFSFSYDPLHLTWYHIKAPLIWRTNPIVAKVGPRVIIAGGSCDFEDDPLAVEVYDQETCTWERSKSIPTMFMESAASTWLSIAVNSNKSKMYVAEKSTGLTYSFDPTTKTWQGPFHLRPHASICCCFIGFANVNRMILIGIIGGDDDHVASSHNNNNNNKIETVKLWEVNGELLENFREIGEMPKSLLEKLKAAAGEDDYISMSLLGSIRVSLIDDFVYIYTSNAGDVIAMCEIGDDGGACNWASVRNSIVMETEIDHCRLTERLVMACSSVSFSELDQAIRSEGRKFSVKIK